MDFVYDVRKKEWVKKEKPKAFTLEDMNAAIMGRFDRVDDELIRLNTRLDGVEAQVWEIKRVWYKKMKMII